MDIQNKQVEIDYYSFRTPTFLLNIIFLLFLAFVYNKGIADKYLFFYYTYIFLFVFFAVKTFLLLVTKETLYVFYDSLIYKKIVLGFPIRKLKLSNSDLISVKYEKVEEGIRIKFLYIYTESIWISKYHSIIINYKKRNLNKTEYIFVAPFDSKINKTLIEYNLLR